MRSAAVACLTCLVLGLIAPAVASADAYSAVEAAFAGTGTLRACRFSSPELTAALKEAPTYDLEYFGDFTDAIQSALSQQAGGACARRGSTGVVSHVRPTGELARLRPPASATAATGASIPLPLALAAGLAAVSGLLGLGLAVTRSRGSRPGWTAAVSHSWSEAEYRLSGAWESFRDWLKP